MRTRFFSVVFSFLTLAGSLACNTSYSQPDPAKTANLTDAGGKKQGAWSKKNAEGQLIYVGQFKDDHPVGEFRYFYPEGAVRTILEYSDDGRSATAVNFHPDGVKMAEGNYVATKKDGPWKYYTELGKCSAEEFYTNGIPVGTWRTFYDDGKVLEEFSYKDGKKEGPWKQLYTDGKTKAESNYVNGQFQGPARFYYPDGKIMVTGTFVSDLKDGIWENFKDTGEKESVSEYANGLLIKQTYFDKAREEELLKDDKELKAN